MLVLSRPPDEKIMIGDKIEITVIGIRGNRVKLRDVSAIHVPSSARFKPASRAGAA